MLTLYYQSPIISQLRKASSRLIKNTHLLRYVHPSSLRRTGKYASFLRISRALHLDFFDQPGENYFFNKLLGIPGTPSNSCRQ